MNEKKKEYLIKIEKTSKNKTKPLPLELLFNIFKEANNLFYNNLLKCRSTCFFIKEIGIKNKTPTTKKQLREYCYEQAKHLLTSSSVVYLFIGEIFKKTKLFIEKMSETQHLIDNAELLLLNLNPLESFGKDFDVYLNNFNISKKNFITAKKYLSIEKKIYEENDLKYEEAKQLYEEAKRKYNEAKQNLEEADKNFAEADRNFEEAEIQMQKSSNMIIDKASDKSTTKKRRHEEELTIYPKIKKCQTSEPCNTCLSIGPCKCILNYGDDGKDDDSGEGEKQDHEDSGVVNHTVVIKMTKWKRKKKRTLMIPMELKVKLMMITTMEMKTMKRIVLNNCFGFNCFKIF